MPRKDAILAPYLSSLAFDCNLTTALVLEHLFSGLNRLSLGTVYERQERQFFNRYIFQEAL